MRHYLQILLFIVFCNTAKATIHNVSVTNVVFSPNVLVIVPGDQVTWTNVAGFHNVNGSLLTFPANPEGFSSGAVAGGAWVYSKVFTVPGTYNYWCDAHAPNMAGTIIVTVPLPIELKSITTQVNKGICKVEWQTDKEENLSLFTLQKSVNAVDFKDVVEINANHLPSTYTYMDDMGVEQYVYYRVKITDNNSSIKYTPIRLAQNDVKITKNTLTIMGNPFVDHMHINVQSVNDWAGTIMVYDMAGRTIYAEKYNFTEGNNYIHIENSSRFPKGLYVVAVRHNITKEFMSGTAVKQ